MRWIPPSSGFLPRASLPRLLEIPQIRRCLVLFGGHEQPIPAQEIVLRANDDLVVALCAGREAPVRMGVGVAPECLVDAPRPRKGVVEHRDLVVQDVWVVLVEVETLL